MKSSSSFECLQSNHISLQRCPGKKEGWAAETFSVLGRPGRAPAAASRIRELGGPARGAHVLGRLLHLRPPAVVGVADEQQDLTPEQHQGRVRGDHGAHPRVQALQAVEAAVRTVPQEPRGSGSDPPERPWKQPGTERITGTRLCCSSRPDASQPRAAFTPKGYTQGSFLQPHVQDTWHLGNSSLTTRFLNRAATETGAPPYPPPQRDQPLQGLRAGSLAGADNGRSTTKRAAAPTWPAVRPLQPGQPKPQPSGRAGRGRPAGSSKLRAGWPPRPPWRDHPGGPARQAGRHLRSALHISSSPRQALLQLPHSVLLRAQISPRAEGIHVFL